MDFDIIFKLAVMSRNNNRESVGSGYFSFREPARHLQFAREYTIERSIYKNCRDRFGQRVEKKVEILTNQLKNE